MSKNRKNEVSIPAQEAAVESQEAATGSAPEVVVPPVAKKPLADRGRGNPNAKKIVNPQPTLELKKKLVRDAGGSIAYANRQWTIELGDKSFIFFSREFAGHTVGTLATAVGLEVPA